MAKHICTAERLAQLQKVMQSIEGDPLTPRTKIQRVPSYLRENKEFAKYYSPKLLSIGPIHHGRENLNLGEQYKLLWTAMYLKENEQEPVDLRQRIEDHIEELKDLYTEDAIGDYNDNDLVWMLFVDGCSVLQFMQKLDIAHPEKLRIKLDQQQHMVCDLHLLENQVPYRVLQLLSKDDDMLFTALSNFSRVDSIRRDISQEKYVAVPLKREPNHLLDYVRSQILIDENYSEKDQREQELQNQFDGDHKHEQKGPHPCFHVWPTYRSIRDLKTAGIRVQKQDTPITTLISFTSNWFSGELKLPWFAVNDFTPYICLNLIAYEMCPDFENKYEISSHLAFFVSLINDANDVKELRSAGVIQNLLGSDEEVAKLFNGIGTELAAKDFNIVSSDKMAYSKKFIHVKYEIEKHYKNKWKTWMAQAYNTHFSNPWSIFAFLAATLALVLTFIQTGFVIHPKN